MSREGQLFTPVEWVERFKGLTFEEKVKLTERMFISAEAQQRCFMENHSGAMRYIRTHRCIATAHTGRRARKIMRNYN